MINLISSLAGLVSAMLDKFIEDKDQKAQLEINKAEGSRRNVVMRQRGERQDEVNRLKGLESDIINSGK